MILTKGEKIYHFRMINETVLNLMVSYNFREKNVHIINGSYSIKSLTNFSLFL